MFIKPTANAKDIWEVTDAIMIYTANEDIACPWDADISVEGDKVILIGSIRGGDASNYRSAGMCRCECSVSNFSQFYKLEVPDDFVDENTKQALEEAGWIQA